MGFIYAYDDKSKEELIENGYEFLNKTRYKGKEAYLFINNGNKLNFSNCNLDFSNKIYC